MTSTATPRRASRAVVRAPGRRRNPVAPYVLLLPAVLVLLLALGYPLVWQVITSFQSFGLAQQFGQPPEFVGFGNYVEIFTDPRAWTVIGRSLLFCLVNAVITVALGVGSALVMKAATNAFRLILQLAMLLAWAMPVVAAVTVWIWLFDWRRGVINWLLSNVLGLDQFSSYNWLGNPLTFYMVATIIVVWMSVPFVAFSVYAGLTQVSVDVLEAADLDGAGPVRRFRHIVVPLIRPVLMIVLLLQIIWDLRVFTQIQMLQDAGAPISETNLLGTFIYQMGVGSGNFGWASAMSIFVLLVTIAFSAFYVVQLLKEDS